MDDSETLLANMTLPPTPTSVIIGNLIAGSSYIRSEQQLGLWPELGQHQNPRPLLWKC